MSEQKYIKTFDVLRVIAVIGVFLYHLMPQNVPSGYLGVVILFVFAGFLSMYQILERHNAASFSDGFKKIGGKILKLYPALIITIFLVICIMYCFYKGLMLQLPDEIISSLLSMNNCAQVLKNESYFEAMNSINPLTHIWALSLEFQFYVLFYLLIFPFYTKEKKDIFLIVSLVLTVLSMSICVYLVHNDESITRIYYGIDSRLSSFMIGCMAALSSEFFVETIRKNTVIVRIISFAIVLSLTAAMLFPHTTTADTIGVIMVYGEFCALAIICLYTIDCTKGESVRETIISKILTYIVKRSYIIYLVHYPIIVFSNRILAHENIELKYFYLIVILSTLIITEIVYRVIGVIFDTKNKKRQSTLIITLSAILLISLSLVLKLNMHIVEDMISGKVNIVLEEELESDIHVVEEEEALITTASDILKEETEVFRLDSNIEHIKSMLSHDEHVDLNFAGEGVYDEFGDLLITTPELLTYKVQTVFDRIKKVNALVGDIAKITNADFLKYRNMNITLIGDSITNCALGPISVYFPNAVVNAEGNRNFERALSAFYELKNEDKLGDIVVFAIGTNADKGINTSILEEVYNELEGRKMIILTLAIPFVVMEQEKNASLKEFANTHTNCYLADWHKAMKTHKQYFMEDGSHPIGLGADVFAQLIFKTAIDYLPWKKVGNTWEYVGYSKKIEFKIDVDKNVGDTVEFGHYFKTNGEYKEPIEWIILDKNETDKTELLITKYAIDAKKFHNKYDFITWKNSDIRKWLNEKFYHEAFSREGQMFILPVETDNNLISEEEMDEVEHCIDKVFLATKEDIDKYFTYNELRCKGTKYFKSQGGYTDKYGYVDWWLRTVGEGHSHYMNIAASGELIERGDYVTTDDFGIRPMIKISTK